ncbi:MAG TPA: isoamylase early set domain-containing protein [Gemmatimonadales bacterium]|nr:isoamylase early set domain-containing protein [Gemmatimonadales bacterium]
MFDRDDDVLYRVVDRLREPIEMDPTLDARVMVRVARAPRGPAWLARGWEWLRQPREFSISPLRAAIAAAGLAGLVLWLGMSRPSAATGGAADTTVVQFVLVAPGASSVALVGDFNDWDATTTPMRPVRRGELWSVTIPLSAGRHRYAFLVDGSRWLADPSAPRAPDDFGTPSSVVTVGG